MPICNDPAIAYLKESGYSVLRLPRADFQPLQILALHRGELQPLGALTSVMVPQADSPSVQPTLRQNVAVSSISGQRTNDLSLSMGLNIIGASYRDGLALLDSAMTRLRIAHPRAALVSACLRLVPAGELWSVSPEMPQLALAPSEPR